MSSGSLISRIGARARANENQWAKKEQEIDLQKRNKKRNKEGEDDEVVDDRKKLLLLEKKMMMMMKKAVIISTATWNTMELRN